MPDGQKKAIPLQGFVGSDSVDALASQVLSVVASRSPHNAAKIYHDLVLQLADGVRSMAIGRQEQALETLRAHGCTTEDIADIYIPAAARLLGDEWCRDEVSFADVTIGTARLQGILRDLEKEWLSAHGNDQDNGLALVIVCEEEYHTLGAMVLAGQLRRNGVSVRLSIGASRADHIALIEDTRFDLVLISAARTENLETTRKFIENIRNVAGDRLPIVLGGPVTELTVNLKALTGADHVTNDPKEALDLCGLKTHHQGADLTEIRS